MITFSVLLFTSLIIGLLLHRILFLVLKRQIRKERFSYLNPLAERWNKPFYLLLPMICVVFCGLVYPIET